MVKATKQKRKPAKPARPAPRKPANARNNVQRPAPKAAPKKASKSAGSTGGRRFGQVLVDLKAQAQTADIAQAQAQLNLAQINYNRWKALGDQGIAAKASVDQYRTAVDQAKAALDAARSRCGREMGGTGRRRPRCPSRTMFCDT